MPGAKNGRYGHLSTKATEVKTWWNDADESAIGDCVKKVLDAGDAILFGRTRDGGAVRIILMSGDEKASEYVTSAEQLTTYVGLVTSHIERTLS